MSPCVIQQFSLKSLGSMAAVVVILILKCKNLPVDGGKCVFLKLITKFKV